MKRSILLSCLAIFLFATGARTQSLRQTKLYIDNGSGAITTLTSTDAASVVFPGLPTGVWTAITTGNLGSINALGTIGSGIWQGTAIGQQYGGTGIDASGATNGQLLIGQSSDHSFGLATLTTGSNIAITNGGHSISIATVQNPTFATSVTTSTIYGGNQPGSSLNLETTSNPSYPYSDYLTMHVAGYEVLRLTATGMGVGGITSPTSTVELNGTFAFVPNNITITGSSVNNDVPLGNTSLAHIQLTGTSGPSTITGFAGGGDGSQLTLVNYTGQPLTLANLTGSSAGNQIYTRTGADIILPASGVAQMRRDADAPGAGWSVEFAGGGSSVTSGGTGVTSLTQNGILYGNGINPIQATSAQANSILITDGSDNPSLSQTLPSAVQGNITSLTGMTGAITYPTRLTFDGTATRTESLSRNTGTNTGSGLTIQAGAPASSASANNLSGGDLTLSSGISEGTGLSNIYFQTPISGSTGNSDNTPVTRLTLNSSQLNLASGIELDQNGTQRISSSGVGSLASLTLGTPLTGGNGGTGSAYVTFTNGGTTPYTYTLPDSNATLLSSGSAVLLQNTTPGTTQTGNANVSGTMLTGQLGIGTTTPAGTLDLVGTYVDHRDSINVYPGENDDVTSGTKVRLDIGLYGGVGTANITGFTGGVSGRRILIVNYTGSPLTLNNMSTSGSVLDRILTSTGGDVEIPPQACAELFYGIVLSVWKLEFVGGAVGPDRGGTGVTSFTTNGMIYGNGQNPLQVTAAAANSVLVTDGSTNPSLSETLPTAVQANISSLTGMSGAITYPTALTFDGSSARTMTLARNTGTNTGSGLTIRAGAPASSASSNNLAGGDLTLSSGVSEGSGLSNILFQTPIASSTGNSDNTPVTRMTLNSSQLNLASGIELDQNGTQRISSSGAGTLSSLTLGTPLTEANGGTGSAYVGFTTGGSTARTFTLPDANATLLSTTNGVELQSSTPGAAQNGNVNVAGVLIADSIGIGTSSPKAGLDVEGTLVYGVDSITVIGNSTNNNVSPGSKVDVSIGISGTAGPTTITGFSGGTPGRVIKVGNITSQNITLSFMSGSSSAGNQIFNATGQDLVLPPTSFVALTYLSELNAWTVEYTGGMPNPVALGGTGATTAAGALANLLPSSPTTGYFLEWNGSAFVWNSASASPGVVTSVGIDPGTTGLTVSNSPITSSGNIGIAGTLNIANGGTGQTTANGALNALLPSQSSKTGQALLTDGTNSYWSSVGTGNGTVTSVNVAVPGMTSSGAVTASGTITMSGDLAVSNGGTGQGSALTQGGVVYGSSTTAMATSAVGTSGQVLISGGTGAPSFTSNVSGLTITNSSIGSSSPSTGAFTSVTTPTVYGGAAAGSSLNLQSTSSGSPSGDYTSFTAGGLERARLTSNGYIGIGTTTPLTTLYLQGTFAINDDTTTITGNTTNNNVSPGSTSLVHIGLSGTAAPSTITGFTSPFDGRLLTLVNLTGQNLTLANNSASSSVGNRIFTRTGGDINLPAGACAQLRVDQEIGGWAVEFVGGANEVSQGTTGLTTITPNGILFGNGTSPIGVTSAAANSVLVTNGSNVPSLSQTLPSAVQANITSLTGMTGTITYPTGITFNGVSAVTQSLSRNTGTNTGSGLTVQAGAPASLASANNLAGGNLTLSSGISEGSGISSILFQTPSAGLGGNADNTPATRLTLNSAQLNLASGVELDQNGTQRISNTGAGNLTSLTLGTPLTGANGGTGSQYVTFNGPSSPQTYTLPSTGGTLITSTSGVLLQSSTPGTTQTGNANISGTFLAGNVGIGTTSPNSALDVKGKVSIEADTTTIVGGTTNNNVSSGNTSLLSLGLSGSAMAATITGFTGGTTGSLLTVVNLTGQIVTLSNNNTGSTLGNRILTETGTDVTILNDQSVNFAYDQNLGEWIMECVGGLNPVSTGGTGISSLTQNGILYGNGTLPIQVTSAAANSLLVTNGSNVPSLSQTLPSAVQGNITSLTGLTGAITYPTALTFDGTAARTTTLARNTGTNSGSSLTIQAGAPASSASANNLGGGNLILSSGISEGSGNSQIVFQTPASGSAGNTDNAPVTRMTLNSSNLSLSSGVGLDINGGSVISSTGAGALSSLTLSSPLTPANGGTGTATAFTPGSIVFAGTGGVYSQDWAKFRWDETGGTLAIGPGGELAQSTINSSGSINSYLQINNQNLADSDNASTDFVATADNGTNNYYYVNMGINGSGYNQSSYSIGKADDAYIYAQGGASTGNNLDVGTAGPGPNDSLVFFTGGNTTAFRAMSIDGSQVLTLSQYGAGALSTNSSGMVSAGTLSVANGGTGQSSTLTQGGIIWASGSTPVMASTAAGTSGQVLVSGGTGAPTWSTQSGLSVNMGGDVTGTTATSTVAKINGATLGTTTATPGNILVANASSQWTSVGMSGDVTISNLGASTIGAGKVTAADLANTAVTANSYGSATQVPTFTVNAEGQLTAASNVTITGTVPGGSAGGDLTGSYPNPTITNTSGAGNDIVAAINAAAATHNISNTNISVTAGTGSFTSVNANSGGITNAGAIGGATTISLNSSISGGTTYSGSGNITSTQGNLIAGTSSHPGLLQLTNTGGFTASLNATNLTAARAISLPNGAGTLAIVASTAGAIAQSDVSGLTTSSSPTFSGLTLSTTPLAVGSGGTGIATAPTSGQFLIGNSGGTAYTPQTMSGDVTITNGGVTTISSTSTAGTTAGTHIVSAINNSSSTGTINVANGGTGAATLTSGDILLGNGTSAVTAGPAWNSSTSTLTGNITGNAATVTTDANLTGDVTSSGNATTIAATATAGGDIISSINSATTGTINAARIPTLNQNTTGNAATVTNGVYTNSNNVLIGSNSFAPTTDIVGLTVKQTSATTPASDIFDVTASNGTTKYISVSNTGVTTIAGTIQGSISGNAATATSATTSTNTTNVNTTATSAAGTYYPLFVNATSGNLGADAYSGLTYNPFGSVLTATTFSGALNGNATTATSATNVAFSGITTGTNATALTIGTGGSLGTNGSGTITATAVPASGITGTTLASNVVSSSLTSVGTLANLTVTGTIAGNINGNAATVTTDANLTGDVTSSGNATTIAANATAGGDIITSINAATSGTINAAHIPTLNQNTTGNAATVTTDANLTGDVTSSGNATTIAATATAGGDIISSINSATTGTINAARIPTLNQNTTGNAATVTNGVYTNSNNVLIGSNSFAPTTDIVGLTVKQTSATTPASDIFDVTASNGTTKYISVSNTGVTTIAGTIQGSISGNAATATSATTSTNTTNVNTTATSAAGTYYPLFVNATSGNLGADAYSGLTYNPSGSVLTATIFSGALNGNATNVTGIVALANGGTGVTNASGVAQNTFFGGPSGTSGAASFRTLVASDIPSLSGSYLPIAGGTMTGDILIGTHNVTGTTGAFTGGSLVLKGTSFNGTVQELAALGQATTYTIPDPASATATIALTSSNITGTSANVTGTVAVNHGGTGQTSYTNGQLLIGNTTGNTLTPATLTAGTGISITNGTGTITIANTSPASAAWSLSGNTSIPAGSYLGTTDTNALVFKTAGSTAMTIGGASNAGNVGIGIAPTTSTLAVNGNIQMTNATNDKITTNNADLVLEQTGDTYGTTRLHIQNRNGSNSALFEQAGTVNLCDFGFKPGTGVQSNMRLEDRTGIIRNTANNAFGEFEFFMNTTGTPVYNFSTGEGASSFEVGNVGIGIVNPSQLLQVQNGNLLLSNSGTADQLQFQGTSSGISTFQAGAQGSTNINYTFPTTVPTANQALAATSVAAPAVTLGWITPLTSPMTTLGDIMYENSTPAAARLAGSTSATKEFLTQTGTGSISAAPVWGTIAAGDIPTLNQNTTGTAANVTGIVAGANGGTGIANSGKTITLGGNVSTSGALTTTGAFALSIATTAATSVTFPTSGLLMGNPMTTSGDMIYENSTPAATRLAGNTTATKNFMTMTSGVPAWGTIVAADVPTLNQNTTGTATNATNAVNIATTTVSNNATYYPLFVASSSNSNQAVDLDASGITYNPSTNALTTSIQNLTGTTNQIVLGTTNTTTLSATAPASSVTYTIPDAGGAGNVMITSGGGLERTDFVTSTMTTTSATQATTTLSFNIGANENWSYEMYLEIENTTGGNNTGLIFQIAPPSSAVVEAHIETGLQTTSITELTEVDVQRLAATGNTTTGTMFIGDNNAGADGWVKIDGMVFNSTTSGTVTLNWASASSGKTITLRKGSYLIARKM